MTINKSAVSSSSHADVWVKFKLLNIQTEVCPWWGTFKCDLWQEIITESK